MTTPGIGFGRTADGYIRAALTVETPRLARGRRTDRQAEAVSAQAMGSFALIGLGSNLGDRHGQPQRGDRGFGEAPGVASAGQLVSRDRAGRRPARAGAVPERRRPCSRRPSIPFRCFTFSRRSKLDSGGNGRSVGASGRSTSTCCFLTTGSSTRRSWSPASTNAQSEICAGAAGRRSPRRGRPGDGPAVCRDSGGSGARVGADRIPPVADPCRR